MDHSDFGRGKNTMVEIGCVSRGEIGVITGKLVTIALL